MITLQQVRIDAGERTILRDISLEIARSEQVVIGGPTGSGKSTILRSIAGMHPVAAGRISIDGSPVEARVIRKVRSRIAWVEQEPVLGSGSARAALLKPFSFASNRNRMPDGKAIASALRMVALAEETLESPAEVLSGGEKQRLAIARALLLSREILILDEVTSALDEASALSILELVRSLPLTVVAVSHQPGWLAGFDRRFVIEEAKLIER